MKNFIKTVGVTSCLVAAMGTTQALSQTRYPDWASNGPALIGAKNGIAPLDSNAEFPGGVSGAIDNASVKRTVVGAGTVSAPQAFLPIMNSIIDFSKLSWIDSGSATGPLATVANALNSGSVINFGDTAFPFSSGNRVPHLKDKSFFFNILGRITRYPISGPTDPGTYIADDSITSGFWPAGAYNDWVHSNINYQKYVPLSHNDDGTLIDTTNGDSSPDYAPVIHIKHEIADKYPAANWGGRNDVAALSVESIEDGGSDASAVPIVASLRTNGTGGFFANSVALKTYTTNYGFNSSWGIDTRIEDHFGLEPHNDGNSGAGYNIVGNEIDVQTYGQDNPNIQYIPFGYRVGMHFGMGLSGTDEAQYAENTCAYHVGDRVLMPEYTTTGTPILDPWGNPVNGVFKVTSVGGTCSSGNGKTGSIPASSWIRGAGATQMWTKQTDGSYSLVNSSIASITSGDTVFVWGEDEPSTVGSVIRVEGTSIENDYAKGSYGGSQFGAGLYMTGSYLDAAIDLSSMECGIQLSDLISGKQSNVPKTSCAAMRLPKDIGIDFGSTADFHSSTAIADAINTQNKHLLKYSSTDTGLEYINSGQTLFRFKDSGDLYLGTIDQVYDSANAATHYFYGGSFASSRFNPTGSFKQSGSTIIPDYSANKNMMSWSTFNDGSTTSGYNWFTFSSYSGTPLLNMMSLNSVNGFSLNVKSSLDSGKISTDGNGNLTMSSLIVGSVTYSALPTTATTGQHIYCSDCYSKLREDGDTATGILVYWNGTRWNDVLGLAVQH